MKKEWTKEEEQFIIDNFNNMSNEEISNLLDRSVSSVRMKARRLNVKRESKYIYNRDFFEEINTEEKAYWLGFIYADGWICINEKKGNSEVGIQLKGSDYKHLQKFNKSLNGNIKVKKFFRDSGFCYGKSLPFCSIRIYCKKMAMDLEKNGATRNKTKTIELPKLSKEMMIPFLRGYFDGDGCLQLDKQRNVMRFDYCSASKQMLEQIREFLYKEYNITSYISTEDKKIDKRDGKLRIPNYRLNFRGLRNGYNFGKLLYENANIYLDRKYKLFNKLIIETKVLERLK